MTVTLAPTTAQVNNLRRAMLAAYAERLELSAPPAPRTIRLDGGVAVRLDGTTPDESLIVQVETNPDPYADGVRARLLQALLTLALVHSERPRAAVVLLVASPVAAEAVTRWLPGLPHGHALGVVSVPTS